MDYKKQEEYNILETLRLAESDKHYNDKLQAAVKVLNDYNQYWPQMIYTIRDGDTVAGVKATLVADGTVKFKVYNYQKIPASAFGIQSL
tara:strand:- start:214 stop:480 length:267 start_codon:yes stop_codon:yes gene_type:complete